MATTEELLEQAQNLNENKKHQDVIDLLKDELLDNARNAALYVERAQAFWKVGKITSCYLDSQKALIFDQNCALAYNLIGNYFSQNKQLKLAVTNYSKAIELNPNNAIFYNNRGTAWQESNEPQNAYIDYTRAIELKPNFSQAFTGRGNALQGLDRLDDALIDYNTALDLNPNDIYAHLGKGNIYMRIGEVDKASKEYNKAVEINPLEPNVRFNRGMFFAYNNKYKEALQELSLVLLINPVDTDAKFWKDHILTLLGKEVALIENPVNTYQLFINSTKGLREEERLQIYQKANAIMKGALGEIRRLTCDKVEFNLVHYTKMRVANIFVTNDNSPLRYYNAVHMNDPEEGKLLLQCLGDDKIDEAFTSGKEQEDSNVYLGSFLPAKFQDELVLWRTYGKDDNNIEAGGCCIEIDCNFFDKEGKLFHTDLGEADGKNEPAHSLYRVLYYNKREKTFVGENVDDIENAIKQLKKELLELLALKSLWQSNKNTAIDKIIYHIISELRYFVKSSDYSFEKELRVIQLASYSDPRVKVDEDRGFPQPLYIESKLPIMPHIKSITLGPKVAHPEQWIFLEAKAKKKGYDIDVKQSNVKFQ